MVTLEHGAVHYWDQVGGFEKLNMCMGKGILHKNGLGQTESIFTSFAILVRILDLEAAYKNYTGPTFSAGSQCWSTELTQNKALCKLTLLKKKKKSRYSELVIAI